MTAHELTTPPATGSLETESSPTGSGIGTPKILGLVAGGVGVAGLAVGSVFGVMTILEKSQQQNDCASSTACTSMGHAQALGDHSTGMTDSTISTVGFIAGGALLVGGAALFFTAGRASEQRQDTGMLIMPSLGKGGGGISLRGEF